MQQAIHPPQRTWPPVKYFTDRSKAVLLLWIIYVISVLFLICFRARLFIDALWSPGKGLTSWLSFVKSNCEVVTFPLVSLVRCGASLYRILMFSLFLTLQQQNYRLIPESIHSQQYSPLILLTVFKAKMKMSRNNTCN